MESIYPDRIFGSARVFLHDHPLDENVGGLYLRKNGRIRYEALHVFSVPVYYYGTRSCYTPRGC